MTAAEFTPTTEQVRWRASHDAARFGFLQELDFEAQFDRWLAEHDRVLAERIAAAIEADLRPGTFVPQDRQGGMSARDRAARIARREVTP